MTILNVSPSRRQPDGKSRSISKNLKLSYPSGGSWVLAGGSVLSGSLGVFDRVTRQDGAAWMLTTGAQTLPLSDVAGDFYGALLVFNLEIADVTSSSQVQNLLSFGAISLTFGSSTGYLTNETLTIVNTGNYRRTGIDENIPRGRHVICCQWNGTEYEIWLDGHLPTQIVAAAGHTIFQTGFNPVLTTRLYSNTPLVVPSLVAINFSPEIDLRKYQQNPWSLFAPEPRRIWGAAAAGYTHPTLSNARMGSLTTTGGIPLVDYTF